MSENSALRTLLHFVAEDLGVADKWKDRNPVQLTTDIRKSIATRDARIAELEATLKQWEPLEQFGSALEISQDLERLWELLEVDGEPYEGEDSLSSLYEHRMARIARLESQIAAQPAALARARREALEAAAVDAELMAFSGGAMVADFLRRMAREVKP